MQYFEQSPLPDVSYIVKSFWQIEDLHSTQTLRDKIVPDGYPELIIHYGDPYKTNISGYWEIQHKELLAGQLSNFFHLENTGTVGMFAIKLQPWTPAVLWKQNMAKLLDVVIPFPTNEAEYVLPIIETAKSNFSFEKKCEEVSKLWVQQTEQELFNHKGIEAIKEIIYSNGKFQISEVCSKIGISERSLERFSKECIGLSPKFYSRIIRLAHIFKLVNEDITNWAQLSYLGGFYDQAHFIKDFKKFTGEEPTKYGFDEINMANFFLK